MRSDNGGLGTLSRMFCEGLPWYRRLAINRIQGERGDFCREPDDRTRLVDGQITTADAEWLCDGAEAVLSFETWYGALIPRVARQMGVRTALVPMYECLSPDGQELRETDVSVAPTRLDLQVARNETPGLAHAKHVMLPIPCDTDRIQFRQRACAEVFVHRAGHQGDSGRNGTEAIVKAWPLLQSPAKLIVYHQNDLAWPVPSNVNIECRRVNFANYWDGWGEGDVFLLPTRHDALSLPIQGALTAGMPVIAAKWWPHCDEEPGEVSTGRKGYLPKWSQLSAIHVSRSVKERMCREYWSHRVTPEAVAEMIDQLYGEEIICSSLEARRWAENRSWERLRPQWLKALST